MCRLIISPITHSARVQSKAIIPSYACWITSSTNLSSSFIAHLQRRNTCSFVKFDRPMLCWSALKFTGAVSVTTFLPSCAYRVTRMSELPNYLHQQARLSVPYVTSNPLRGGDSRSAQLRRIALQSTPPPNENRRIPQAPPDLPFRWDFPNPHAGCCWLTAEDWANLAEINMISSVKTAKMLSKSLKVVVLARPGAGLSRYAL